MRDIFSVSVKFERGVLSAGEEDVVDLTCEGSEPAAVVDLTNNDSVVVSLPLGTLRWAKKAFCDTECSTRTHRLT